MDDGENVTDQVGEKVCVARRSWFRLSVGWFAESVRKANLTAWKVIGAAIAAAALFAAFYFVSKGVVDDDMDIVVTSSLKDGSTATSDRETLRKQEMREDE